MYQEIWMGRKYGGVAGFGEEAELSRDKVAGRDGCGL